MHSGPKTKCLSACARVELVRAAMFSGEWLRGVGEGCGGEEGEIRTKRHPL